ncbi:MAG: LuxR C-terminal-related transcriptional regulator [Dehalococcoidia bacterium]
MPGRIVGRDGLVGEVLAALRRAQGCVLLGGSLGIGKTALALEVRDRLVGASWHVETCIASPAGASVPLGALYRFLPDSPLGDPALTMEQTRRRILATAGESPLLLLVDDVHHLDTLSVALLHRLVVGGRISVLLTYRSGEPLDETLTTLWKDGYASRIEVPPLDREAHDAIVESSLGAGHRHGGVSDRLWTLTAGNPLFLLETLSQLSGDGGVPTPSVRLSAIVQSRLSGLDAEARRAIEIIALATPLRLEVARRLVAEDALVELEARELANVVEIGGVRHVETAHPIYAETIRSMLPALHRSALATDLAGALASQRVEYPGDALRAATALLDAGVPIDTELAVRAGRESLNSLEPGLAERLVAPVIQTANGIDALLVFGTALSVQSKSDQAREVLTRAVRLATDERERALSTLALARHLLWIEHDFGAGLGALRAGIARAVDPASRAELRAELALMTALGGDVPETLRLAEEVLGEPRAVARVTASALLSSTLARTMLGRFEGLDVELERGEVLAEELRRELPLARDQFGVTRGMWLQYTDLEAAADVAESGYARALAEGGLSGLWSVLIAMVALERGDVTLALRASARAADELTTVDPFHNLPMARSMAATAYGMLGNVDEGEHWFAQLGPLDDMVARNRLHADRAAAWLRVDRPAEGARVALEAGLRAEQATLPAWAALPYGDAVLLGHPELVLEHLGRLAAETDAPAVALFARHAASAADWNPEALVASGNALLAFGSPLFASAAYARAASSEPQPAARARRAATAWHLAQLCGGPALPDLLKVRSPLSPRELEVARYASAGRSDRELAELLGVSVRTVGNHLHSIFTKLGLGGRGELPPVFPSAAPSAVEIE